MPVIRLYEQLQTQWHRDGNGVVAGLNYAGVQAALAMLGVRRTGKLFRALQVMEIETVKIMRTRYGEQR